MGSRGKWWGVAVAMLVLTACADPYDTGLQAFEQGDWPTAITNLERVGTFDAHSNEAEKMIGQSLFNAGNEAFEASQWTAAVDYFKRIKTIDPNHAIARDRIGCAYYELATLAYAGGDYAEALRLGSIVRTSCSHYDKAHDLARQAQARISETSSTRTVGE